ncbi:hypothetical protein FRC07_012315, partial [Ceratobasidium sp. 392]
MAVQAPSPEDPQVTRATSRSFSAPVVVADPEEGLPGKTQGGTKRLSQRGVSLPVAPGHEYAHHYNPALPSPPAIKPSPLTQTLYVGSKDLTKITHLDILIVPNSYYGTDREIRDPDIDTTYLRERFGQLDNVTVHSIPDDELTLGQVDKAIAIRWEAADEGTCLLVLLTGHGDGDNAMMLYNGDRIDESHLNILFQSLRREHPKQFRIVVAFDICRESQKKALEMHHAALVWSCSPSQEAWAFGFEKLQGPSSAFLLGFLLAAYDAHQSLRVFEKLFEVRVAQLARYNNHVRHVGGCKPCMAYRNGQRTELCPDAFVMRKEFAQRIDLRQSQGLLNDVYAFLVQQKRFRELSETVFEFMSVNDTFLKSNNLPLRGANMPISQGL